jgi:hypothetical protein
MALNETQEKRVLRRLQRYYGEQLPLKPGTPCPVHKNDGLAAIRGACAGLESAQAAINTAIPQPARGAMSAADKKVMIKLIMDEIAAAIIDFGD